MKDDIDVPQKAPHAPATRSTEATVKTVKRHVKTTLLTTTRTPILLNFNGHYDSVDCNTNANL